MYALTNLTSAGNQTTQAVLSDGSAVTLTFNYRAGVQRWSFDVSYKQFSAKALGLSSHPNRLRTWRNIIPFGLQISTSDGTDPFLADDLSSGRVIVSILDNTGSLTDVEDVEKEDFS